MKDIYERAIEKFGKLQLTVAIEELSELQKEICKAIRNKANIHNITEEITDVKIMLEQLEWYFDITDSDIENVKNIKLKRLEDLINCEEG